MQRDPTYRALVPILTFLLLLLLEFGALFLEQGLKVQACHDVEPERERLYASCACCRVGMGGMVGKAISVSRFSRVK